MPAFTFEKISAPKRLSSNTPAPVVQRRSAIASFIDRLTQARLRKFEKNALKFGQLTESDRK